MKRADLKLREDRALVAFAIAGDDAAFREIVLRHQPRLRALLRRLTGNAALADDIAQTAFFKAWQNLRTLRTPDQLGAWLRRIALNAAMDAMRVKTNDARLDDDAHVAPAVASDERLDLDTALARLSFPARTCVLLFHGENMSHADIAAETNMPLGTVKSHIARATPLLRAWLKDWRPTHG